MTWRLLPGLLPQLAALGFTWNFCIAGVGQGAHYVTAGWWGTLLGLVVLTMGLAPMLAGAVVGMLLSLFVRVPPHTRVNDDGFVGLMLGGGLFYAASYLALASVLWQFSPPAAGPHATYGTSFVLFGALAALSLGMGTSACVTAVVARRGPPSA